MTRNRHSELSTHHGRVVSHNLKWRANQNASALLYDVKSSEPKKTPCVGSMLLVLVILSAICRSTKHRKKCGKTSLYTSHIVFIGALGTLVGFGCVLPLLIQYFIFCLAAKLYNANIFLIKKREPDRCKTITPISMSTLCPTGCIEVCVLRKVDLKILLIIAGDIELNPGPTRDGNYYLGFHFFSSRHD